MNISMNKKHWAKVARVIICLMALVVTYGCATPEGRVSGKSWSQTSAKDERAQELSASPQDDWKQQP
jgi:hypothetical protein